MAEITLSLQVDIVLSDVAASHNLPNWCSLFCVQWRSNVAKLHATP